MREALGLAIFMCSACFFGALLEGDTWLHQRISSGNSRQFIMAVMMGATAFLIFSWKVTAASGAHINPAVTIVFWRLGKLCHWDAIFYILFQLSGGTTAVIIMRLLLGKPLIDPPVLSVVTVPGKSGPGAALIAETVIAFITMLIVLWLTASPRLKKYSKLISATLVCCWVILAGPISGFGMNPARTISSALPSGIWTAWWIYLFAPILAMLFACECYQAMQSKLSSKKTKLI